MEQQQLEMNLNNNEDALQGLIRKSTDEIIISARGGMCGVLISIFLFLFAGGMMGLAFSNNKDPQPAFIAVGVVSIILFFINNQGFFTILPNEAVLLTYSGKYVGTVKENGFFAAINVETNKDTSNVFKLISACFKIACNLSSNCFQIALTFLSNCLSIAVRLLSNCFQITLNCFKWFSNCLQVAFKVLSN